MPWHWFLVKTQIFQGIAKNIYLKPYLNLAKQMIYFSIQIRWRFCYWHWCHGFTVNTVEKNSKNSDEKVKFHFFCDLSTWLILDLWFNPSFNWLIESGSKVIYPFFALHFYRLFLYLHLFFALLFKHKNIATIKMKHVD